MQDCGVTRLVADTRFLTESTLLTFFWTLVSAAEGEKISAIAPTVISSPMSRSSSSSGIVTRSEAVRPKSHRSSETILSELNALIERQASALPGSSSASCSWMEIIVVDSALRNRDRFAVLWPILESHYERTLLRTNVPLSYANER